MATPELQMKSTLKRLAPTVAALIVVAVTSSLGSWQLRRAEEREALAARQEATAELPPITLGRELLAKPESLSLHPLAVSGVWRADKVVFLDNQIRKGRVGFDVIMPMQIEGSGMHVLVDRGWILANARRDQLPEIATPAGKVEVRGIARQANFRFKELGDVYQEGRIWENVTIERFAAWSKLELQPVILMQTNAAADGLARDWPKAGSGSDKNRGYAFQWFAMTVLTIFLWGYYFIRGRREREGQK